jgi:hypothetical protein
VGGAATGRDDEVAALGPQQVKALVDLEQQQQQCSRKVAAATAGKQIIYQVLVAEQSNSSGLGFSRARASHHVTAACVTQSQVSGSCADLR